MQHICKEKWQSKVVFLLAGAAFALFALAAPGWLLGCETLHDCMKLERLRA